ncbi:MAG: PAS domain S-box protein [Burkholderiales bacterium]|nr:PAS domain S-box protein [Burkholderiales bacterium]
MNDPRPQPGSDAASASHEFPVAARAPLLLNEQALEPSAADLRQSLADTQLLHRLAIAMAAPGEPQEFYERLMDAAVEIMHSDYASMQLFFPERGEHGELLLLAQRGFNPDGVKYWKWVALHSGSTCGEAFRTRTRCHVVDVERCGFIQGDDLASCLDMGMRSAQTTPLISRAGVLIGMISTHWNRPHQPSERDFRMFDVLARHAADLIERAQADEALRESEQRLRTLAERYRTSFDLSNVGKMEVDATTGKFALVNDAYCRIVGWDREELLRMTPGDLVHAEDAVWDAPRVAAFFRGETDQYSGEKRFIRKDRSVVWVRVNCTLFRDTNGAPRRSIGVLEDITEQKRAEAALRASEERFRSMANTTPAIIWTADPAGAITFHNQRWLDYTGIDPLHSSRDWPRLVLHPEDYQRCVRAWSRALRLGTDYEIEVRNRRHDGQYRWFLTRATPIRDTEGRIIEWYGSSTDIHDRKQAEAQLVEADRRKDEFLATLAHELRNPLAPLRNGLHVLSLAKNDRAAIEQARSMMERQLGQMVHLVNDLLDLSRISRDVVTLRKECLPLAEVVHNAVETSRPLIDAAGHDFSISVPPDPVHVHADGTRLAQVFANLLNNAARYTEHGGRIRMGVECRGGDAIVTVKDNGVGIPPQMLHRVFDAFTQVDGSLEKSRGGLGIGLAIVKRLVEMHGGGIEAKSDGHGMGSEFVVRLPVVASPAGPDREDRAREPQPAKVRRRILIVDDNRDAAASLAMIFGLMGDDTAAAHDGLQALDVAASFRPDVILLDIRMPKLNGYDTARHIREQPWGKRVTLVALTGDGQDEDKRKSRAAGFDAHMVKPIEPTALEELLATLHSASR